MREYGAGLGGKGGEYSVVGLGISLMKRVQRVELVFAACWRGVVWPARSLAGIDSQSIY